MESKIALITRMKRAARVYKLSSNVLRENVLLQESCVMDTKIVQMEVMKTNIVVSEQTLVLVPPYSWNTWYISQNFTKMENQEEESFTTFIYNLFNLNVM